MSIVALAVLFFIASGIYLYYWLQAIDNLKEKKALSFFMWPYLFMPNKFEGKGNIYRAKALFGVAFLVLLMVLMYLMGVQ